MGLLDSFLGTPDQTQALGLLGMGLMSGRGSQGFARGAQAAMGHLSGAEDRKRKGLLAEMQMQEMQQKISDAQRQREFLQNLPSPTMQASQSALMSGGGPTMENASQMPAVNPMQDLMFRGVQAGAIPLGDYLKTMGPKQIGFGKIDPKDYTQESLRQAVATGDYTKLVPARKMDVVNNQAVNLYDTKPGTVFDTFDPNKPFNLQGGQMVPNQPFQNYDVKRARAGAPQTSVRVENKMGESLAGQVGPMVKDSRIQTDGAVKMFDAADRIERALNSNKVLAGPGASQVQTVRQITQMLGGGNDEGIRQTRQVIKSLAQMAVEARKQLQGQGQVTESEAKAVMKADAGDINDMTVGELRDLVALTKRAAHYTAKGHSEILNQLGTNDGTAGLVPFYRVPRMDELLQHKPELPQIGAQPPASAVPLTPQEQQELKALRERFRK